MTLKRDSLGLTLEDWILALIAYAGGRVDGVVRIQKGLFLVKSCIPGVVPATYTASEYGPVSRDVDAAVYSLVDNGYAREYRGRVYDEGWIRVVETTMSGFARGREVLDMLVDTPMWSMVRKCFYAAVTWPVMRLLSTVYTLFPDYALVARPRRRMSFWMRVLARHGVLDVSPD